MSASTNFTNYRGVVTGAEVLQIIRQSGGDEVAAARALRVLMEQMQFTGDAEAQAMSFIRIYGSCECSEPARPLTEKEALSVCLDNFNLLDTAAGIGNRDGVIARCDLQAILEAPDASPRLKAAAKFLLDRFSRFDDAAGKLGKEDGLIARIDLEAGIADSSMDRSRAIDVMRGNFDYLDTAAYGGGKDGLVSKDDLKAAVNDPSAAPEVKAAARYALAHPELFDMLDIAAFGGGKDGLISKADLDVGRETERTDSRTAVLKSLNYFDTIDDYARNLGRNDGLFARCDLQAIVNDANAPADLKAAARYLLDHPEVLEQMDAAAYGGSKDGLVSRDDARAWLAQHPGDVAIDQLDISKLLNGSTDRARTIDVIRGSFDVLDTAAYGGTADGRVSRDDIAAGLRNPSSSPELKEACRYMLAHPELFDLVDTAGYGGSKDGIISKDDLKVARELVNVDDYSAARVANDHFSKIDTAAYGGSSDGLMSRDDLKAILSDPNAAPDLKAAAHYILDHPAVFDEMDIASRGGGKDGLISREDLRSYMQRHEPQPPAIAAPQISWIVGGTGGGKQQAQDPFGDDFQNQIEDVLTDPTLTIEDQVTLFLMLIAKQMDRQIQQQMEYVNQLQQQQNKAGAANGANGTNAANGTSGAQSGASGQDTSIDVETLKLKRLIDKRSQLFDTLRQIIDKYNQTAKAMIDTINR